ncbi:MAG: DUF6220 domain-containing protein [Chloroflexota bacterium]|nr:DUF6220 domain-containing protein [Chloroflexota bacterium]
MTSAARYAYALLAWVFLVGLIIQVFLAGLGLFASAQNFALHVELGWILHLAPLLVLLAAALSRAGRRHVLWAAALAGVVFAIPIFAIFRADMPVVAAVHPVAAMVGFGLAAMVALNSLVALRAPTGSPLAPATDRRER